MRRVFFAAELAHGLSMIPSDSPRCKNSSHFALEGRCRDLRGSTKSCCVAMCIAL